MQRAAPAKLADVVATAGNAQVTLSWDAPDDDTIANYDYRIDPDPSDGSSGWTGWQRFTTTTNSHTVSGLTNGTTYSFQVRANNDIEGTTYSSLASETVSATPTGPPEAPDLRADGQSTAGTEVRLYWANPGDSSITRYQKHQKKGDEAYGVWEDISFPVAVNISTDDPIEYTVTGLTSGATYTFQVRAINDKGEGAEGTATAVTTTSETAPAQMSGLVATVTGVTGGTGGTVTFTWINPRDDSIDHYEYRYDGSSSSPVGWDQGWWKIPGTNNNKDLTTWSPGIHGSSKIVFYELRAVNDPAGDEYLPGDATAITVSRSNTPVSTPPPPSAPTGLTAAATPGQVELSWTVPSGTGITAPTDHEYRQSTDGGSFSGDWASTGKATAGYTVTGLDNGTEYTFEVRGVTVSGDSKVNGASTRVGPVIPGAPNAPTLVSATETDDATTDDVNEAESQIVLSWTAGTSITGVVVDDYEYRQLFSGAVSWSAWHSISGDGTEITYTVTGLLSETTYSFQLRAKADSLASDPSNVVSGTTATPEGGNQPPEAPTRLRATAGNEQVTLNWSHPSPGTVKWYRYRFAEGNDASTGEWQQVPRNVTIVTGLENGTTYSFQVQAVGAGNMISEASDTVTATPRVPPRPTGPQRDSVMTHNSDETIDVTIEKPASVTLDVAVRDQSCAAAAPAGTVHLCVQASASGALENLAASPAFMTIVISAESWTQMEGAYNADPRRFFLSKRSSPGQAWANITWCLDDPAVECYLLHETEQGGATMFVYNIVSFSQYAIRTVGVDGVGGGGGCVGINCRAVIIGGGSGTGRGPQHRLPATTRTPAPTARPTATPTVRPTVVPPTPRPTVRPTLVPPTPQPTVAPPTPRPTERPTAVAPTVAPTARPSGPMATAPAAVATPPPPTDQPPIAPTPPPPSPTEAPTLEPTGETAALPPPTEPVPAITAVPPAVEPGNNLTMWLIIVIVIAVAAVGGMGFVAFRLLRAQ